MESQALALVGLLISVVGGIWFLVVAFSKSIWWGLGCLICSLASLVFLVLHFGRAWKPAAVQLVGLAIFLAAGGVNGVQPYFRSP